MRNRALVLVCVLLMGVTVLAGSAAAQQFEIKPEIPKDYDEEDSPPIVYEDRRFDFEVNSLQYDFDMFETDVWYPHEYVNVTVVPASTAWDLDITRENRDAQTALTVRGELDDDYEGKGFSGSTVFKLHVSVKQELRYATLRIEPMRVKDVDGVPYDSEDIRSEDKDLEVYPYPKPESDIEVTDVEVSPQEVSLGDRVSAVFEAENSGDARGSHSVEMLVDGQSVDENKSFSLEGGETYSWEFWHTFEPGEYEPGEYDVSIGGETVSVEVVSSGLVGIEVVGEEQGTVVAADSGVASADSEGQATVMSSDNSSANSSSQGSGDREGQQMPGFTAAIALIAVLCAAAVRSR